MKWKIPYFELVLGKEEKSAVLSVLDSNWLTTGPKIKEFEIAFAKQMAHPQIFAIAVSNCTVALHLALKAIGVSSDDEVICPSLTFVASANAIRYCNATPIFADICSEEEWNLDPVDVQSKITNNTKAILVVHYAGYPCRMDAILDIARKHNLMVVEDACHGPLAEWKGQKLGTIGDIGCFSFFGNKNMTTGEGGMVVTKNAEMAEKVKNMRSHGMTSTTYDRFNGHAFGYDVTMLGYNYRMDEMRAAIGIEQLKKLPTSNLRRRQLVEYYRESMRSKLPDIIVPFKEWEGDYGYHIFPVLLPEGYDKREELMARLVESGIQTSIHYRPIHTFTSYKGYDTCLPKTETIASRILSLPLYPHLTLEKIDKVIDCLVKSL